MKFGKKLKDARNSCGYTQKQVEEITGFEESRISHWENDKARPCADNLFILCRLYGISPNDVYGWESKDDNAEHLTSEEKQMLKGFRGASPEKRKALLTLVGSQPQDDFRTSDRQEQPRPATGLVGHNV